MKFSVYEFNLIHVADQWFAEVLMGDNYYGLVEYPDGQVASWRYKTEAVKYLAYAYEGKILTQ